MMARLDLHPWWELAPTGRLPSRESGQRPRRSGGTLDRLTARLIPTACGWCLFTDNDLLIEAGAGYFPFKDRRDDYYGQLTFSDLYLRHPRSLLVDSAFVRPHLGAGLPRAVSSEVDGWIDALPRRLASRRPCSPAIGSTSTRSPRGERWLQFRSRAKMMRRRIEDDAFLKRLLQRNAMLHARFTQPSGQFTISRLTSDHLLERRQRGVHPDPDRGQASAPRARGGRRGSSPRAKSRVRRLTEESWSDFFNTAADTGLEIIGLPAIDAQTACLGLSRRSMLAAMTSLAPPSRILEPRQGARGGRRASSSRSIDRIAKPACRPVTYTRSVTACSLPAPAAGS